jgi:hypothetical protein
VSEPQPDFQRLVDRIVASFLEDGDWPTVDALRHALDREDDDLDILGLASTFPPSLGRIDLDDGGRASLTVRGVVAAAGGQPVLAELVEAAGYANALYRDHGPDDARLTSGDLAARNALS